MNNLKEVNTLTLSNEIAKRQRLIQQLQEECKYLYEEIRRRYKVDVKVKVKK